MKKLNKYYFIEFESKYSVLDKIDSDWYKNELAVKAFCNGAKVKDTNGNYSEEWYRARFVYMMVKSGKYDKNLICVELSLPKGNGGKSINPDIVAFKNNNWSKSLEDGDYDKLRAEILVVFEAKDNPDEVEKAIKKQIEVALERRVSTDKFQDWAYGVYFDNQEDIILIKKEGLAELERYNISKMIPASKNIVRLNVADRDSLEELPELQNLIAQIDRIAVTHQFYFDDLDPIGQESFEGILDYLQREKDKIQHPNAKRLLVEALMIKVNEENNIKLNGEKSCFYISKDEIRTNGSATLEFRKRIYKLYEEAKENYNALEGTQRYIKHSETNITPINQHDEKMLIAIVKSLQGKSILRGVTTNFNQTIFNNFGDEVEKTVAGQFFTPIPIILAIISIINPRVNETFIDPCSGICDFQAIGWKHTGVKENSKNYYGVDISSTVLTLAELNLVLNGAGTINLYHNNSLFEKLCIGGQFTNIDTFNINNYDPLTWKSLDNKTLDIKRYDTVNTNPPFGQGRDLRTGKNGIWDYGLNSDIMKMYETWSLLGEPKSIDMGIIFLENAYRITKPGGRFAIVLSNSIASIQSWDSVRLWLFEKVRLVATIDLPQNCFGETGVSTTVLIAYKPKEDEKSELLSEDYDVFTRNIKYTGYEVKTVKRNIVFEPVKEVDPVTLKDTGKLKEDFTKMIGDFEEYMKSQNAIIKSAFGRG
ncbi:N-6 DNA methylase [Clostridium sp.]|uniref:HsdM family class I SAM-dependent methyltransferase n=1 Tax=Clostridium sp. TaxID=1506 RepID=UPI001A537787|nr:N-6 DNA methylase [Clostridium sp.]MBK5241679.1 N-6 DNA methylase [Clostridium sp.]